MGDGFSLLGYTLVPKFISSVEIDYLYLNMHVKTFINGLYRYRPFRDQRGMFSVIFFEAFFDPLYQQDAVHLMITLDCNRMGRKYFGHSFTRVMGVILRDGWVAMVYPVRRPSSGYAMMIDEMNYTNIGQNPFHDVSYFNNDNYDERMGWGAVTEAEISIVAKTKQREGS